MRAVVCKELGPVENLVFEPNWPDPVPGKGEVVVDVKSGSVNFPDVLMIQGKYQFSAEPPFVPGSELAGVISAVGEGVTGYAVGERVIARSGTGAFGEKAKAKVSQLTKIPEGVDFDTAATFMVTYGTTHHALIDRAQLKPGETLLVLGAAGGVGMAAVELGKLLGAKVIAAASTDEKLAVCREHGADATINYSTEDLRKKLAELTDGKGPDVIYDPVGGSFAEPAFRSIAWRGRYLVIGFANGEIPKLPLNLALLKGASIVGVFYGSFAQREPVEGQKVIDELMDWVRTGKIKPLVSARYKLEDTVQALQDMSSRKVTGKIVIVP
ncbi:NADPH:quinone oxidoreductase family protein [Quisquiliibacterium transsilvanicum]|jgi:NADPH2:quinone reductase|uniref:NADPH2:quinone reductase n=1 Tax=Quisquiliibacterium transsilvanicum TaxID=1549638 RepID=A0A7W8M9X6_9BURK|nr:NADPH:quinone oxidoreductase family protein [Quisquiliibacterium transsilvanicum]MBB5272815.1 NADPH2:quinone reductase [Quisquiliibacterium transsilvanicum]